MDTRNARGAKLHLAVDTLGEFLALVVTPAEQAAQRQGIRLEVVKLPEARHGFVLLPRRWVVERSFAWLSHFRRLAKDYERLPETLVGLHLVAFSALMLGRCLHLLGGRT